MLILLAGTMPWSNVVAVGLLLLFGLALAYLVIRGDR